MEQPECPKCGCAKFNLFLLDKPENRRIAKAAKNVILVASKKLAGKYECRKCKTIFVWKGGKS